MLTSETDPKITIEIIRKAIMGTDIKNDFRLLTSCGGKVPQECTEAIQTIIDNPGEFEALLRQRLLCFPLTKHFFSHLIRPRLRQKGILSFPVISIIFDPEPILLEQQLHRIQSIPGIESLRDEYRGSSNNPSITDQATLDLLAEILVLDFLLELGFEDIAKISKSASKSHPDIVALKDGKNYAIEVTRKQEIEGWETLEYGNLEDCTTSENHKKIRALLVKELASKNKQFSQAVAGGTLDRSSIRTVAIKTSDFGFMNCIDQATQIANNLLSESNWEYIDCIWFVPNIVLSDSRWICNAAH